MNRLILISLLFSCLVALSSGKRDEEEEEIITQQNIQTEELAGPESRRRGKKCRKGKGKCKKRSKGKKGKCRKGKGKCKKRSKGKKGKKKGKKKSKKGQKKRSRYIKKNTKQTRTCLSNTEVQTVSKNKKMADNWLKQYNRATTHKTKMGKKNEKNDTFTAVHLNLLLAGGGNLNNLSCGGSTKSTGATNLKKLIDNLKNCEGGTQGACGSAAMPTEPNSTALAACKKDMETFVNKTVECETSTDTSCFSKLAKDTALQTRIKACVTEPIAGNLTMKKYQKAITKGKANCTSAFGACRKLEDTAANLISSCKSTTNSLTLSIKALSSVKATVADVVTKVAAVVAAAGGRKLRQAATTCSAFNTQVAAFRTKVDNNPYDTSANSTDIKAFAGTCSGTDLTALKALNTKLAALTKMIDAGIASLQGQNTILSGTTASPAAVSAATQSTTTTASNVTTASNSTKSYRERVLARRNLFKRSVFKNLVY